MPIENWIAAVDYAPRRHLSAPDELPPKDERDPHPFIVESMERFSALPPGSGAKIFFTHLNHSNPLRIQEP